MWTSSTELCLVGRKLRWKTNTPTKSFYLKHTQRFGAYSALTALNLSRKHKGLNVKSFLGKCFNQVFVFLEYYTDKGINTWPTHASDLHCLYHVNRIYQVSWHKWQIWISKRQHFLTLYKKKENKAQLKIAILKFLYLKHQYHTFPVTAKECLESRCTYQKKKNKGGGFEKKENWWTCKDTSNMRLGVMRTSSTYHSISRMPLVHRANRALLYNRLSGHAWSL